MTLSARLREARREAGLSQARLAKLADLTQPTLSSLENGESKGSSRTAQIAAVLGVNALWLAQGEGPKYLKKASTAVKSELETLGRTLSPSQTVKVVGEIMGGSEGYLEESLTSDNLYILAHTRDLQAYAVRVRGDSMRPRYRPGEYLLIEPSYESRPGEDVAICLKDGRKMLKELIIMHPTEIEVLSVSDGQRLTISRKEINSIHRVAGHYQRYSSLIVHR